MPDKKIFLVDVTFRVKAEDQELALQVLGQVGLNDCDYDEDTCYIYRIDEPEEVKE